MTPFLLNFYSIFLYYALTIKSTFYGISRVMEEKIKISISRDVLNILDSDAEFFELNKPSGALNRNSLLNRIVVNYNEQFSNNEEKLRQKILKCLGSQIPSSFDAKNMSYSMAAEIEETFFKKFKIGKECTVSLKPTKKSSGIVSFIQKNLHNQSLSGYFRRLFSSYVSLPRPQREIIIFKDVYETIVEAIKTKSQVYISTSNNSESGKEISPYALMTPKEEFHCYVLGCTEKSTCTYRLNHVFCAIPVHKSAIYPQKQIDYLNMMMKYGPQYRLDSIPKTTRIYLTDHGLELYRKLYVYRPIPDSIEKDGHTYVFNCSKEQLFHYFCRFGSNAVVLTPSEFRKRFIKYYKRAAEELTEIAQGNSQTNMVEKINEIFNRKAEKKAE